MFKLCSIACFSVLASAAYATGIVPPSAVDYFSGAYVGVGLGAAALTANATLNYPSTLPFLGTTDGVADAQLTASSFAGQVNLGYGHLFNRFYLAGEIGYQYTGARINDSFGFVLVDFPGGGNITEIVTVSRRSSMNLSARFGYAISSKVLPYIVLGANYGQFKIATDLTVNIPGLSADLAFPFTQKTNVWGFFGGVGMMTAVNDHWLVGLEGDFVYPKKQNVNGAVATIRPTIATLVARVSYRFNV